MLEVHPGLDGNRIQGVAVIALALCSTLIIEIFKEASIIR